MKKTTNFENECKSFRAGQIHHDGGTQTCLERTKLEQELRKIQDERSELEEKYSNRL